MAVRLKDIAKKANVSIATVSKIINNKASDIGKDTIIRVEKIIKEEGYVPNAMARAMKTNRSYIIGLLIPDIRNPFFTEIARGAEDLAYELGYSLFLCNTDDDLEKETKYINSLQQLRIDGIIIAGSFKRNRDTEISLGFNIPLIAIDREIFYKDISCFIKTNNYDSSKEMVEKLYADGYRSFFYLGGPVENSVSKERFSGTKDGLKGKDIKKFESCFGRFSIEDGYRVINERDDIDEFDVIICGNDLIAIGALNALKNKSIKVPEQMGVVGFDDIALASTFIPTLTTIKQPSYQMGADAIILIDEIIKGKSAQPIHMLTQRLIFRDTTRVLNDD